MSVGPHVNEKYISALPQYGNESVERAFSRIVDTVRDDLEYFLDVTAMWKTQYTPGCGRNDTADLREGNWKHFPDFDRHIWRTWPNDKILDVSMFSQVKHAHICSALQLNDGMHYCVPGPLDAIPKLLLTALRGAKSK